MPSPCHHRAITVPSPSSGQRKASSGQLRPAQASSGQLRLGRVSCLGGRAGGDPRRHAHRRHGPPWRRYRQAVRAVYLGECQGAKGRHRRGRPRHSQDLELYGEAERCYLAAHHAGSDVHDPTRRRRATPACRRPDEPGPRVHAHSPARIGLDLCLSGQARMHGASGPTTRCRPGRPRRREESARGRKGVGKGMQGRPIGLNLYKPLKSEALTWPPRATVGPGRDAGPPLHPHCALCSTVRRAAAAVPRRRCAARRRRV